MKHMKKILALMLAVVMTLAMSVTAFADETTNAKIKFPADAKYADHQYEVYQIFTGEVEGTAMTNLKYGENTKTATNKGKSVTEGDLETIAGITTTNEQDILTAMKAFVNLESDPVAVLTKTDTETTDTEYSAVPGYYLIKDVDNSQTGVVAYDDEGNPKEKAYTLYILEVVGADDYAITPKASMPSVEKKVDDINDSDGTAGNGQDSADYDIGDWVPYHLKATTASNVDKYTKYHLTFVDTLEAGKFDNIKDIVIKVDGKDISTEQFVGFTVEKTDVTPPSASGFEIKLTFEPAALEAGGETPTTLPNTLNTKNVTIDFKAQLGTGATVGEVGNVNTVKLKFSNNPNDTDDQEEAETPEDTVIVFTYKTVIDKVDPDGRPLKGAEFKLYKKYTADQLAATGKTASVVKDADGEDIAALANTAAYSYVKIATVAAITPETTSFAFNGIDDGEYVLVETKVPDNYTAINPIVFTVTGEHTAICDPINKDTHKDSDGAYILTGLTATGGMKGFATAGTIDKQDGTTHSAASGEVYGEIVNSSGAQLPVTGGIGTTMFYVIGAILVIGAGVVLVSRRRMSAN